MSDTTISISSAGPSYYGLLGELVDDSENAKQQVDLLSEQAGTGLISQSFSGLGTSSKLALDLGSEIGHETTWSGNISAADTQISLTQTSMNQIGSIASSFYALTDSLNGADPAAIDDVAGEARTALQEVAGLLDTTDEGNYVFAGQDSSNPPVPDPDDILTSGFYTQINAAVSALSTNGATATAASTLAIASSNAAGTSPFSTALSQPAASLQGTRTTVTITNNQTLQIGLLASANAAVTSTGTSTTGSYMRDLLRGLATIGSLSSSQVSDSGFEGLVADTRSSLGGAITAIDGEEGILGDTQAQIDATGTILSQTQLAMNTQLSDITDVDLAKVATKLTAAQTQLTASYKLISSVGTLSLVNFI